MSIPDPTASSVLGMPLWLWALVCVLIMFVLFQFYYWLGRKLGERLYESRLGRKIGRHRILKVENLVRRRGAVAVFGCFWVPVLRHTLPSCAGVIRISYPWYVVASALGALLWTPPWVVGGYAVIWAWLQVAARSPVLAVIALAVAVPAVVALFAWRRRRRRAAPEPVQSETTSAGLPS
ncbi:VTT domain-containing protein [Thermopolyspora sp. NPDC052614]|uniref:DedA family protein n=1 Tax=Thermopolyspora sp. NPDC052614 TaxID=3155682 RepID=UPI00342FE801